MEAGNSPSTLENLKKYTLVLDYWGDGKWWVKRQFCFHLIFFRVYYHKPFTGSSHALLTLINFGCFFRNKGNSSIDAYMDTYTKVVQNWGI